MKRPLGRTGLIAGVLALGTVKFGRTAAVKYPRRYALPSDGRIADLLAQAKALGVNLLDTAPAYGRSEERLGEALQGQREDWLLCTKAGEEFDGARSRYDFGAEAILRSVARSLARLRTDVLDVVLVHADGRDPSRLGDAFGALRRLQAEGVIRAVGYSGKGIGDGRAALPEADVLMCTINRRRRDEAALAAGALRRGVGVMAKKPMASGAEAEPAALAEIAALPGVGCVVTGTLSPDHLAANAAAINRP